MKENLNKQIVKGISWNLIETGLSYFIRFFIGIILARLLTPEDFGIVGMTAIFISVSDVFVRAGFGQAYIYKKEVTAIDANTVFFLNICSSILLYLILFLFAPYIAVFFHTPILSDVIRILCLVIIVNSLNVIQYSIIRREMKFKRKAIATVSTSLLSGGIGIGLAYAGYGVWSLVIQQLSSRLLLCIFFYATSKWKPSFQFSWETAKNMFGYSIWIMFADILITIMNNFYRLAIGKRYSAVDVGYYDRGHQFQALIADTFTWVFGMVAFPSFTKVKDDTTRLQELAYNYVKYSTFLIFPLLLILFVVAEPFTILLLTEKWSPIIPLLKMFCVIGLLIPINFYIGGPLLQACGMVKMAFSSTFFLAVSRIINVIVNLKYGIIYILYGEIIVLSLNILVFSLLATPQLGFNYLSILYRIKENVIISLLTLLVGVFMKVIFPTSSLWMNIIIPSIGMINCYIILNILFQREIVNSLFNKIRSRK